MNRIRKEVVEESRSERNVLYNIVTGEGVLLVNGLKVRLYVVDIISITMKNLPKKI